jgi:hypothetical protein
MRGNRISPVLVAAGGSALKKGLPGPLPKNFIIMGLLILFKASFDIRAVKQSTCLKKGPKLIEKNNLPAPVQKIL